MQIAVSVSLKQPGVCGASPASGFPVGHVIRRVVNENLRYLRTSLFMYLKKWTIRH